MHKIDKNVVILVLQRDCNKLGNVPAILNYQHHEASDKLDEDILVVIQQLWADAGIKVTMQKL